MNLDDLSLFKKIDLENMQAEIDGLPDQLQFAWKLGQEQPLPTWEGFSRALVAGMGGSAIGADLLSAHIAPVCHIPVIVHRDYGLPAWARGPETLVLVSSHSGNTEETLDAFETALQNDCRVLAIATGGKLAELSTRQGIPFWQFEHHGMPRAAVGFSFGLLLGVFTRLGLIPDPSKELSEAIITMKEQQARLCTEVPATQNPAKRLAGQLFGRWVLVFGADMLAPVARRWKTQINELAKAGAGFDFLPEADHNTLAGLLNPEETLARIMAIFLLAPSNQARNRLRVEMTRQTCMVEGLNTDTYEAPGKGSLAQMWSALHFGDYAGYYLAMAYGVDPTPVAALENFKAAIKTS